MYVTIFVSAVTEHQDQLGMQNYKYISDIIINW
jgi:hypothetical protein